MNKTRIGEYLGHVSSPSQAVLVAFLRLFDFSNLDVVEALRFAHFTINFCFCLISPFSDSSFAFFSFLVKLKLSIEFWNFSPIGTRNNIEDVILHFFITRFLECNPEELTQLSCDKVLTLSYALIMLNTSLHNPKVAKPDRINKQGFSAMCMRGELDCLGTARITAMFDNVLSLKIAPCISSLKEDLYAHLKGVGQLQAEGEPLTVKNSVCLECLRKGKLFTLLSFVSNSFSHVVLFVP